MSSDDLILAEVARILPAWSAADHGAKGALVAATCRRLDISVATYHRLARRLIGRTRQRRADAGQMCMSRADAVLLSAYLMASFRRNGKQLASLTEAVRILRDNDYIRADRIDMETGEIIQLSDTTIARALRAYNLHPDQLLAPRPHTPMQSLHPNHLWQMDASVCVVYYLRDGVSVREMSEAEFYTGKLENFEKIKGQMVIRYLLTDHYSGMLHGGYVLGAESGIHAADHLIQAMQQPADLRGTMYGVPGMLMVDPGSAVTGEMFRRLCRRMDINLIVNKRKNPRAKGQVEGGHNLIETHFEAGLKMLAGKIRCLDDLNTYYTMWERHWNATRVHSRHGATRQDVWLTIAPAQLVLPPAAEICRDLATNKPESRTVRGDLTVEFRGAVYDVDGIPGANVKAKLDIHVNPWRAGEAVVIAEDENGREIHYPLMEKSKNAAGFYTDAAIIGEHPVARKDTEVDRNRKEVERLITGKTHPDDIAKALESTKLVPMAALNIDPLKRERETELPQVLPRHGEQMEIGAPRGEVLLPMIDVLIRLRGALDRNLTPDEHGFMSKRFSDGASEEQLGRLIEQFSGRGNDERREAAC